MGPLISLIIIVFLSVTITKIGTQALMITGLSKDVAKFQARSAFTGVGYTTREAEKLTNQPARRKILMMLMLVGNIGVVSAIASLMLTFLGKELDTLDRLLRIGIILFIILVLWGLSKSNWLEKRLEQLINRALKKYTNLDNKDYISILKLQKEYEITVIVVNANDWLADKRLDELQLREEGVNLIGIERKDGTYLGTPDGATKVMPGDRLTIYGRAENLKNLEQRKKDMQGDADHQTAKENQSKKKKEQEEDDRNNQ